MPFVFEPASMMRRGGELELRGCLRSGAFFGPELLRLVTEDGRETESHLHSHGLESPEGWPVVPEHAATTLILTIPAPPEGFKVVRIIGCGTIGDGEGKGTVDLAPALMDSEWWAYLSALHFWTEEVEEPGVQWFGVSHEDLDEWYAANIDHHLTHGRWPVFRTALNGGRFIELEMAAGVEHQDRVWIRRGGDERRVLLGYYSGHFSLPALRWSEMAALAEETRFAASNLIWLAMTSIRECDEARPIVEMLVANVPGLLPGKEESMVQAILESRENPEVAWRLDPRLGWINDSKYSQRNPESGLSAMTAEEFSFVFQFFGGASSLS